MELNNDFRVSVEPHDAWKVLSDVERIAPLLPGAQLQEVEGDDYRGIVKVKVGPITAQYKGTATFVERDEAAGKMVLKATGRDTRGQGNANAMVTLTMSPDGSGTKVNVSTDLTITGKVAQFGRGVLADVSGKLISQFVDALEADLSSDGATETVSDVEETAPGPRPIDSPEPEPVDLFDAAGGSLARRLVPLLGVAAAVVAVVVARRRRSRQTQLARLRAALPARPELPSINDLRRHLPDLGDLPSVDDLRRYLPDLGDLPSVDDLRRYLPDIGDVPSVDDLRRHLPDLSGVTKSAKARSAGSR